MCTREKHWGLDSRQKEGWLDHKKKLPPPNHMGTRPPFPVRLVMPLTACCRFVEEGTLRRNPCFFFFWLFCARLCHGVFQHHLCAVSTPPTLVWSAVFLPIGPLFPLHTRGCASGLAASLSVPSRGLAARCCPVPCAVPNVRWAMYVHAMLLCRRLYKYAGQICINMEQCEMLAIWT